MLADTFKDLADLPRWVPWLKVWNPKREKFDKLPHTGKHGLSTKRPDHWMTMTEAGKVKVASNTLSGVGIVMTGGVEFAGWRLVGFDYDDVKDGFKPLFPGYLEVSPSKTGRRSFAWVPAIWAQGYQDNTHYKYDKCHHAEIYIGSSPRFLTVTFDVLIDASIPRLNEDQLIQLAQCLKKPVPKAEKPDLMGSVGKVADLSKYAETEDQKHLLAGTGSIDHSAVVHGLLIKAFDGGVSQADLLATLTAPGPLFDYCLSHRNQEPARAIDFAKDEIARAYKKSLKGMRESLKSFNEAWALLGEEIEIESFDFPTDLYAEAPGLIGDVARWIMGATYRPRQEFAYACALSLMACLIGPYCTMGSRGGKLNLYLTMVGETGSGKSEALGRLAHLMSQTEVKDMVLDFPASEAALRRQLNMTPNILLKVDEFAHKLESMEGNSNGSGLGRAMLEVYDGQRMPPKVYAEERKCLPAVENPYVQIISCTTHKVWDVVKSSHMDDGTLNRFVFISLPENPVYSYLEEPDGNVPKDLKDRLNAFWRQSKRYDLIGDAENYGRHVTFTAEVKEAQGDLDKKSVELGRMPYGSLYARFGQHVSKIAAILAIADGATAITMKHFKQAKKFMEWSLANTHKQIGLHIADSKFEKHEKKLLQHLQNKKGRILMRDAYRLLHIPRREMEELLVTLGLAQQVETYTDPGNKEWVRLIKEEKTGGE